MSRHCVRVNAIAPEPVITSIAGASIVVDGGAALGAAD
jgi:hypothetical protein